MANNKFIIKNIIHADWDKELELIGFDKSYRHKFSDKLKHKNLKIYKLTVAQANILKQIALSVGADCAVNRDVVTGNAEQSDAILCGSISQIIKIVDRLKHQPFSLSELGEKISNQLNEKSINTKIVGILNLTQNSFSDGGKYYGYEDACRHFTKLVEDGADIIDIGAESTKPNAYGISPEEQLSKIIPMIEFSRKHNYNVPISIDTRSSIVASECLKQGASIINDVSGLKYDENMAEIIAKNDACLILQHSAGMEVNRPDDYVYESVVDEVFLDLNHQIEYAKNAGINSIIVDVGLGFDKNREDSFRLMNRIEEFYSLGYPVMTGVSRKSMLNMSDSSNEEKDIYTVALNTLGIEHHVDYLRVHNVKLHKTLINIYQNELL